MKASEIRSMTREELEHELAELREEEFRLRLRRPTEELPNALRLRTIRRDIARIQTVLKEDKLGIIQLPKKSSRADEKAQAAQAGKKSYEGTAGKGSTPRKVSTKKSTAKKSGSAKSSATKKSGAKPAKKTSGKKSTTLKEKKK